MNVQSLHQKDELKLLEAKCGYDELLRNCHTCILDVYTLKQEYKTLYGIPFNYHTKYYKFVDCIIYIINSLRESGFYVRFVKPNYLYISWYNSKLEKQRKENIKQLIDEDNNTQKLLNKKKLSFNNTSNSIPQITYIN